MIPGRSSIGSEPLGAGIEADAPSDGMVRRRNVADSWIHGASVATNNLLTYYLYDPIIAASHHVSSSSLRESIPHYLIYNNNAYFVDEQWIFIDVNSSASLGVYDCVRNSNNVNILSWAGTYPDFSPVFVSLDDFSVTSLEDYADCFPWQDYNVYNDFYLDKLRLFSRGGVFFYITQDRKLYTSEKDENGSWVNRYFQLPSSYPANTDLYRTTTHVMRFCVAGDGRIAIESRTIIETRADTNSQWTTLDVDFVIRIFSSDSFKNTPTVICSLEHDSSFVANDLAFTDDGTGLIVSWAENYTSVTTSGPCTIERLNSADLSSAWSNDLSIPYLVFPSPGNQWIACANQRVGSYTDRLLVLDQETGDEVFLSDDAAYCLAWDHDGSQLAILSSDAIKTLSASDWVISTKSPNIEGYISTSFFFTTPYPIYARRRNIIDYAIRRLVKARNRALYAIRKTTSKRHVAATKYLSLIRKRVVSGYAAAGLICARHAALFGAGVTIAARHLSSFGVISQIAARLVAPFGSSTRIAARHLSVFGVIAQIAARLVAPFGSSTRIAARHLSVFGVIAQVAARHTALFGSVVHVAARNLASFGVIAQVAVRHLATSGIVARIAKRHRLLSGAADLVAARLSSPATLALSVAADHQAPAALLIANPLAVRNVSLSAAYDADVIQLSGPNHLIHNANIIPIGDGTTLSIDEGSPVWLATIEIMRLEDYAQIQIGDEMTLMFWGTPVELICDGRRLSREAAPDAVISAISPLAQRGAPWDVPVTLGEVRMAQTAVETVLGESVDWNLIDWRLPTSASAMTGTPLELARQIAGTVAGVIESDLDGSIRARRLHPVSPPRYASVTPAAVLTDRDLLSHRDEADQSIIENRYVITSGDTAAASSHIHIDVIAHDDDTHAYTIRAYPWPWREVSLVHTGDSATVIDARESVTTDHDELIEILAGSGSTHYPIDAITSSSYQYSDLGAITTDGQSITTAKEQYSLIAISYTARAWEWQVTNARDETIQFLAVE